jgi:hypothetical protein
MQYYYLAAVLNDIVWKIVADFAEQIWVIATLAQLQQNVLDGSVVDIHTLLQNLCVQFSLNLAETCVQLHLDYRFKLLLHFGFETTQ